MAVEITVRLPVYGVSVRMLPELMLSTMVSINSYFISSLQTLCFCLQFSLILYPAEFLSGRILAWLIVERTEELG